ncbi:MAG: helix-turn-helix transcriptional regulator [Rhodanobacteraceae bacterium]|nr:helix-turn-helix transcriptional regulator [Rhodanobacteraceae bacterium]HPF74347.1 metalloregulator ArsR/SmtB family transcription factor [Xanthomonadaceae bacterium]HRY00730.1 metalloregulator ArsR/SmtB family transcription factor [Xanthomonadaceae bacterium]
METEAALASLAALAQPSRLAIFRLLVQAGPDGLGVGDLRDQLDLPGATLSAHLNVLRRAGLVQDRRDGRHICCFADFARMNALIDYLTENCCAGAGCGLANPGAACGDKP